MKAIILAAGMGTRLAPYTNNCPKGLLEINNKSLIEHQINLYRNVGIHEIAIITGYKADLIKFENVTYFHNTEYRLTNMVETLMCAQEFFNDDIIISYSDILFSEELLRNLIKNQNKMAVTADIEWKKYWMFRYDTTEMDLESFTVEGNQIIQLGNELTSSTDLDYRYVGIMKFSYDSLGKIVSIYNKKRMKMSDWSNSNQPFLKGYMTDLLQEIIDNNLTLCVDITKRGWLEFDTVEDYERVLLALKEKTLEQILEI